jgi:nicotinamide mononucleotide (NMN) deamidase PncC
MQENCVSDSVARQMALGATRLFLSHYGIGVTGYASVMPEAQVDDLYAHFAIASNNDVMVSKKITSSKKDSIEVQVDFTNQILYEFEKLLKKERP